MAATAAAAMISSAAIFTLATASGSAASEKPATASAMALAAPKTPATLTVPGGRVVLKAFGKGVQIYTCKMEAGKPAPAWAFREPDAMILDAKGAMLMHHRKGPVWETSDGSKVTGIPPAVQEPAPAAATAPAIPWLRLPANGTGRFANVHFVQRVDTTGGTAPKTGCEAATVGAEARVEYTANYYFYEPVAMSKKRS